MHRNNGQGLLKVKINLSLKLYAWVWLPTKICSVRNLWSYHPARVLSVEPCFYPVLWPVRGGGISERHVEEGDIR